ncbi:MAG: DUF4235 domain-containing protein [Planctomycetes bacterium]|nr:DUF4235 domain-containing protein [Planctomycetota bacterium]
MTRNHRNGWKWKALGTGAAVMAGVGARSALKAGWTAVTDDDPPLNPADSDTAWSQALMWTVAAGVTVGLARLLARRGAAEGWRAWTGSYPGRARA